MSLKKPCLIAETPRAGRWNGCLIISEGTQIDHATAVRYTTEARKLRQGSNFCQGSNYLMVSREVKQPTTGRTGDELLILAGIVPKSLSGDQKDKLRHSSLNTTTNRRPKDLDLRRIAANLLEFARQTHVSPPPMLARMEIHDPQAPISRRKI